MYLPDFSLATQTSSLTVVLIEFDTTKYCCIQPDHTTDIIVSVTGIKKYKVTYLSLLSNAFSVNANRIGMAIIAPSCIRKAMNSNSGTILRFMNRVQVPSRSSMSVYSPVR